VGNVDESRLLLAVLAEGANTGVVISSFDENCK